MVICNSCVQKRRVQLHWEAAGWKVRERQKGEWRDKTERRSRGKIKMSFLNFLKVIFWAYHSWTVISEDKAEDHRHHHGNQTGYDIGGINFHSCSHRSPVTSVSSDKKVLVGNESVQIYDIPAKMLVKSCRIRTESWTQEVNLVNLVFLVILVIVVIFIILYYLCYLSISKLKLSGSILLLSLAFLLLIQSDDFCH